MRYILIFCLLNVLNDYTIYRHYIIHGHNCMPFQKNMNNLEFYVPIPPIFLLQRVLVSSFILVWVIDTLNMFIRIYVTLIGLLTAKFLGDIELGCNIPTALRGSLILHMPRSIIIGLLLEFSLVCLCPRSKAHILAIVTFILFSYGIMILKDSYKALLINVMAYKNIHFIQLFV